MSHIDLTADDDDVAPSSAPRDATHGRLVVEFPEHQVFSFLLRDGPWSIYTQGHRATHDLYTLNDVGPLDLATCANRTGGSCHDMGCMAHQFTYKLLAKRRRSVAREGGAGPSYTMSVSCPTSVEITTRTLSGMFTNSTAHTEFYDNALEALVRCIRKRQAAASANAAGLYTPQIVIQVFSDRRMIRVLDNGDGLATPAVFKMWAEEGKSHNDRTRDHADASFWSANWSHFGVGSKAGACAMSKGNARVRIVSGPIGRLMSIGKDYREIAELEASGNSAAAQIQSFKADHPEPELEAVAAAAAPDWGTKLTCFEVERITGEGMLALDMDVLARQLCRLYTPFLLERSAESAESSLWLPLPEAVEHDWRRQPQIRMRLERHEGGRKLEERDLNQWIHDNDASLARALHDARAIAAMPAEGAVGSSHGAPDPIRPLFLEGVLTAGEKQGKWLLCLSYFPVQRGTPTMPTAIRELGLAGKFDVCLNGRLLSTEALAALPFTDPAQFRLLERKIFDEIPPPVWVRFYGTLYLQGDFALANSKDSLKGEQQAQEVTDTGVEPDHC